MLLGKNGSSKAPTPTAKKILDFFTDAARAYSKDAKLSREARRHYKRFKAMFDAFAEWNKGRNAETAVERTGDGKAERRTTSGSGELASPKSIAWKNVAYDDSETKAKITADLHKKMVEDGLIVKIPDKTTSKVKESYPNLQGMKKKERLPILKDSIKQLKNNLRAFLTQLKDNTFEFEVAGDVLEAKLYNVGIDEVLEKVTQDKAEMLYTTEEIFRNSKYLYSTPDYDGDPNIYRWNYFYTPVQIGENVVGVRIAIRDMMNPQESQIYNWGIKKDTSLDGTGRGTDDRISYGISSDVSSNPIVSQNGEKSTDSAKKVSENSAEGGKSIRKSKDITPKVAEEGGIEKSIGKLGDGKVESVAGRDAKAGARRAAAYSRRRQNMTVGELRQMVARYTGEKVYTSREARETIDNIWGIFTLSGKNRAKLYEALWQGYNSCKTDNERAEFSYDMAEYITVMMLAESSAANPDKAGARLIT